MDLKTMVGEHTLPRNFEFSFKTTYQRISTVTVEIWHAWSAKSACFDNQWLLPCDGTEHMGLWPLSIFNTRVAMPTL